MLETSKISKIVDGEVILSSFCCIRHPYQWSTCPANHPLGLSDGQQRAVLVARHQKPILTKCSSLKHQYMKQYQIHLRNMQPW